MRTALELQAGRESYFAGNDELVYAGAVAGPEHLQRAAASPKMRHLEFLEIATLADNDTPLEIRDSLPYLIRLSYRRMTVLYDLHVGHLGITAAQFVLLCNIYLAPDLEQAELAAQAGFDPATTSGILGRLEKLGWISRTRSLRSRRGWAIRLSVEGQRRMAEIQRGRQKLLRTLVENLSTAEEKQLLYLMAKMTNVENSYYSPPALEPSTALSKRARTRR